MSYVTHGRTLLEYAAQLEGKIDFDVPISIKGSDLYIVFSEKAFSNALLLKASESGSTLNELLGFGADPKEKYDIQSSHASKWLDAVKLDAINSLDPDDWLVYCLEKGGLEHILWSRANNLDVVAQYHWSHDMAGLSCKDLHRELLELSPVMPGLTQGSREGIGFSKNHDGWSEPNRRQRYDPFTWKMQLKFRDYPLHRRGRQPRGKSLADKRKGNLDSRYIKEYS